MSTQPTITAFTEVWSRVSLFEVPDTLNLILGNTVEIPVGISNTRVTEEPSVTVREVSGADGKEEKYLGSLFYNADTKKLTITPEKTGTGIIRIADLKTGSFTDMAFAVNTEGVNIVTTNPALTFTDGKEPFRVRPPTAPSQSIPVHERHL